MDRSIEEQKRNLNCLIVIYWLEVDESDGNLEAQVKQVIITYKEPI
jgi:hypothetical protein